MITSEAECENRLIREYSETKKKRPELFTENIGELTRIYIDTELSVNQLKLISKMFALSAMRYPVGFEKSDQATRNKFEQRIEQLRELCLENVFSFGIAELDNYLDKYRAQGCPAVSHSQIYREAYAPSYRVVDSRFARILKASFAIEKLLSESTAPIVVAIDGRCASGKTTSAMLLAELFPAEIVHVDDFFLPPELRTPERLSEVGGNLHRERFICEVISHIRSPKGFEYRVFECSSFKYANEPRIIKPSPLIICEGSYSLHPDFGQYYDLALFSDISEDEQLKRIRARNGEFMLERFKNEWIPMEERYFNFFNIRNRCMLI